MAGTNYFAKLNTAVRISLTEDNDKAVFAECVGNPSLVATDPGIYVNGCIMRRTDQSSGSSLYENYGTIDVPAWALVGSLIGSTSGIRSDPPPGLTTETWLGEGAGSLGGSTTNTVFLGINAGQNADNADESVFIGSNAGAGADSANTSVFIGQHAGELAVNATNSMFLGYYAGESATDAAFSSFFGYEAGRGAANGYNSMYAGFQAGKGAFNANDSVFLGYQAGLNDTVNNSTGPGWSILIGQQTSTGGFGGSIALGKSATNTMENELYVADSILHVNFAGLHYTLPTVQAAGVLTNDGAGNLTWA